MTDETRRRHDEDDTLLEQIPPTADKTPGDAATRAAGPGWREDPESQGPFVVDEEGMVVDTGSPQDYGEPNDDVVRS